MPYDIFEEDRRFCVYSLTVLDTKGDKVDCFDTLDEARRAIAELYEDEPKPENRQAQMSTIRLRRVSEFSGKFPDVSLAPGVNYAELTEGDPDPFFVTVPVVPDVGAISENGVLYDEELVDSIYDQIIRKRPAGIFGHVPESDPSRYPPPAAFWVGALRDGKTLWAKAYVMPGAGRERLRTMKAVGAAISTSIYGRGDEVSLDTQYDTHRLVNFELEQIDFAPPERASLGYASPVIVTREQRQAKTKRENEDDMTLTKEQLAALRPADIPATVREQLAQDARRTIAELRKSGGALQARVAELTGSDGGHTPQMRAFRTAIVETAIEQAGPYADAAQVTEAAEKLARQTAPVAELIRSGKVKATGKSVNWNGNDAAPGDARIAELTNELADLRREAVDAHLDKLLGSVQLPSVRTVVRELVQARQPRTKADAESAYNQVINSDAITTLSASVVRETMGPPQRAPLAQGNGQARYFKIPQKGNA